jgi:lipopolysaccharide/colanic/teichoic acid biosynthesis glycosyltransferase
MSLEVLPGMTDYASIVFANQAELIDEKNVDKSYKEKIEPEKNRLRIKYIKEKSLLTDAKIIFQTLLTLLKKTRPNHKNSNKKTRKEKKE